MAPLTVGGHGLHSPAGSAGCLTPRRVPGARLLRALLLPLVSSLVPILPALVGVAAAQVPAAVVPAAWGDSMYPALGQAGLDVRHYDVQLRIPVPGTRALSGVVTLDLRATRALPLVSLDLVGPVVFRVTWNGQSAPFSQTGDGKLLILRPLAAREEATVRVEYAGEAGQVPDPATPFLLGWQATAGGSLTGPGDSGGVNFAFGEPDGTRTFLPVNDHPGDPATYTVHLTVPRGVTAVASGAQLGDVAAADTHTVTFEQRQPIAPYALAVHVGPLERVVSAPELVGARGPVSRADYFPPDVGEEVRALYRRTGEMLRVLSGWFGPYPFDSYGSVVTPPGLLALETATLSTMPVTSSREPVIVHELAHQWFGDHVPVGDWADVWLNEGFATYAELLWAQAQGQGPQAVAAGWYARLRGRAPAPLVARTPAEMFGLSAYLRGALALHALRVQVGDPAFRAFLRAYVAARGGQPTRTADLLDLARRQLGPAAEATLLRWIEDGPLPPLPVLAP